MLVRDGSEPGLFRQAHEGVEVDRILVGVAMVGVEGRRVRAAAVAPGDLRRHVVGLDDDNAVLLGVRDPAPQVLHEVLFEQRIRDRPAFLVRVGPGGHRPARIKREFGRLLTGLGVAAVVIDEGADVQAVLDREPDFPKRRGKTVRIGDVAESRDVRHAGGLETLARDGEGLHVVVRADHYQRMIVEVRTAQCVASTRAYRCCSSHTPSPQPMSATKRGCSAMGSRLKTSRMIASASSK